MRQHRQPQTAGIYARESHGSEKSQTDQLAECERDTADCGWTVVARYRDGSSASRFATRTRDDWRRVVAAVEAHEFDALVLWEGSRASREPIEWFTLLATCRGNGVLVRITADERTYDLHRPADWKALADTGVDAAHESEKTAIRVRRGLAAAAAAGKPHAHVAYGFVRRYDEHTREFVAQEEDPATAPVVREIFERIAKSEPTGAIIRDLNERGVPAPSGGVWRHNSLGRIARRADYAGFRVHKGQRHPALWEPIVEPALYFAVQRVLDDPVRVTNGGRTTRPGAQRWLLSRMAKCDLCGADLCGRPGRRGRVATYRCDNSCVSINMAQLDEFVRDVVLARVAQPDTYSALRQAGANDDRELLAADAEIADLRDRLDGWRRSAAAGRTTEESLAVIEADLAAQIRQAEARKERVTTPPALRILLDPDGDVRARWDAAPVAGRRTVLKAMVEIRVMRASAPGVKQFEPARLANSRWVGDPLTWGERMGLPPVHEPLGVEERRRRVRELRAEGLSQRVIAARLGISSSVVCRDLAAES